MDMVFSCPNCKQQLEAASSMAGTEIQCPSCSAPITIPEANPATVRAGNPITSSAAAKETHHFQVPLHEGPSEVLIQKPRPPLEVAAQGDKRIRVKTIRRTDCVEVGRDRFDEVVSEMLQNIGEPNIINITPIVYTHLDLGSRQLMTDFGVMLVYKG
jgi:DNA-directed RNA polymerase subunit RPC12/RpoP